MRRASFFAVLALLVAGIARPAPKQYVARSSAGQISLAGTIQAFRAGYLELALAGRAPLWVRELGARIDQNGRLIGPNFLRVGETVQVQGRMVEGQLWATAITVLPPSSSVAGTAPSPGTMTRTIRSPSQSPNSAPQYAFHPMHSPLNYHPAPSTGPAHTLGTPGPPELTGNRLSWAGQTFTMVPAGPEFVHSLHRTEGGLRVYLQAHKPSGMIVDGRARFRKKTVSVFHFVHPSTAYRRVGLSSAAAAGHLLGGRIVANAGLQIVGRRPVYQTGYRPNRGPSISGTIGNTVLMSLADNIDRAAFVQKILSSQAPASPWNTTPTPVAPQQLNPNNLMLDPSSVYAFSGELLSNNPCQFTTDGTAPVFPPACPILPLYVQSPTVTLTVPTHFVVVTGSASGNPQYTANAMPVAQIELQQLATDPSGNPIVDLNDPDGISFKNIPGQPAVQPASTVPASVVEPFNGSTPAWFWDIDADKAALQRGPLSVPPTQAPCAASTGRDCSLLTILYPNPAADSSNSSDVTTFTLQLTSVTTVIRFEIQYGIISFASAPVVIVLKPLGAVQLNVMPTAILYQPPGNLSTGGLSSSTNNSVLQTSTYNLSASQTQGTSNSGSVKVAATASFNMVPGLSIGVSGSYGTNWDNSTSDTSSSSNSSSNSISQSVSATSIPGFGPMPATIPPEIWQPKTQYVAFVDLVQPNPPDGNAYLCISTGTSDKGPNPPEFQQNGITQDGTAQWEYAGSAAIYEEPFWNDQFLLKVHPQYALYNFAGVSGAGAAVQALPLGVEGGTGLQISVFDLHLCAKGLNPPAVTDAGANPPFTLTPYECAGLLNMDPFYMNGQHANLSASTIAQLNAAYPNGLDLASPSDNDTISNSNTSTTGFGKSTGSSFTDSVSATQGTTESLGISASYAGSGVSVTATNSNSQTNSSGMTTSYQDSTSSNQTLTNAITASLKAVSQAYPLETKVYVDTRFGTLMFPAATATITGVSPTSGACGTPVVVSGIGLSGTTQVDFNGIPAVFVVNNDDQITAIAPSLPGASLGTAATISISGEGIPVTNAAQQFVFQQTQCP